MTSRQEVQSMKKARSMKMHEGETCMSSLRIAEILGESHDDVIRDIERIFTNRIEHEPKGKMLYMSEYSYCYLYCYMLKGKQFDLVASRQTAKNRLTLVREFISYDGQDLYREPSSMIDALKVLVRQEVS